MGGAVTVIVTGIDGLVLGVSNDEVLDDGIGVDDGVVVV